MAEAFQGELPPGLKRCGVCAEPINEAALKCIHCSAEQGWLRAKLGLSSTILSLLVALVSVLTAGVPVLKTALSEDDSRLVFSLQSADDTQISVLASNLGNRPGSVGSAELSLEDGMPETLAIAGLQSPATIIQPGQSQLLSFVLKTKPFEKGQTMRSCTFAVVNTAFDGQPHFTDLPKEKCPWFDRFVAAHKG